METLPPWTRAFSVIHTVFSLAGDLSVRLMFSADTTPALWGCGNREELCPSLASVFSLPLLFTFLAGGHDVDKISKFCTLSLSKR